MTAIKALSSREFNAVSLDDMLDMTKTQINFLLREYDDLRNEQQIMRMTDKDRKLYDMLNTGV